VSTDSHSIDYIIILHELPALVLIIILNGCHGSASIAGITPVGAVTELRAAKLTGIVVIKHLLNNNLEVLL
jgi:hypothetical protein